MTSTPSSVELITCLARLRVRIDHELLPAITHRCTLSLPHVVHYCPCRVAWVDAGDDQQCQA
jgi:hypothetical protein